MVNTTHMIDYSIKSVSKSGSGTEIALSKDGVMPMPVDIVVTYKNGKKELFNIPLRIMRGNKPAENADMPQKVLEDWPWTHPEYSFNLPVGPSEIEKVEIDPAVRMVDVNRDNNIYPKQ